MYNITVVEGWVAKLVMHPLAMAACPKNLEMKIMLLELMMYRM
jgi:hypothetical protein